MTFMNRQELSNAVEKLDAALEALGQTEHEDTRLMPIYAEYWVANELAKNGFEVELANRRSFDILLPEKNLRIEVKSGKFGRAATASFYLGHQIQESKFDFCVFVTYDIDFRIKEAMIFSREELEEVASKPRPHLAAHPSTNSCMLLKYDSLDEYLRDVDEKDRLVIEIKLHKFPNEFVNNWDKIRRFL